MRNNNPFEFRRRNVPLSCIETYLVVKASRPTPVTDTEVAETFALSLGHARRSLNQLTKQSFGLVTKVKGGWRAGL